ncbi:hypothetical protein TNCV_1187631 [Trichonephila clavipes]|nr:hypothetical protein TNCV_1187631 [Trichonephila clavipes]
MRPVSGIVVTPVEAHIASETRIIDTVVATPLHIIAQQKRRLSTSVAEGQMLVKSVDVWMCVEKCASSGAIIVNFDHGSKLRGPSLIAIVLLHS